MRGLGKATVHCYLSATAFNPKKWGCCKYKSFDPTFSKVGGFLGQRPESTVATVETPKTFEKSSSFCFYFSSLKEK